MYVTQSYDSLGGERAEVPFSDRQSAAVAERDGYFVMLRLFFCFSPGWLMVHNLRVEPALTSSLRVEATSQTSDFGSSACGSGR